MAKVDVKVVLLGAAGVGKTCLVERYLHRKFIEEPQATIGAAFNAKKITIDGQTITLGIWDTAGSERYESMSRIYYRSAKAAIVCYDKTRKESFARVQFWVEELKANEEDHNAVKHHVESIHENRMFQCLHCSKIYRHRTSLHTHIREYHEDGGKKTTGKGKGKHELREYECSACRKRFTTKNACEHHIDSVHMKKRYPCTYPGCTKVYTIRSSLLAHERVHRGIFCKECLDSSGQPLKFESVAMLRAHVRNCHQIVCYQCPFPQCINEYKDRKTCEEHWATSHKEHYDRAKEAERAAESQDAETSNQGAGRTESPLTPTVPSKPGLLGVPVTNWPGPSAQTSRATPSSRPKRRGVAAASPSGASKDGGTSPASLRTPRSVGKRVSATPVPASAGRRSGSKRKTPPLSSKTRAAKKKSAVPAVSATDMDDGDDDNNDDDHDDNDEGGDDHSSSLSFSADEDDIDDDDDDEFDDDDDSSLGSLLDDV